MGREDAWGVSLPGPRCARYLPCDSRSRSNDRSSKIIHGRAAVRLCGSGGSQDAKFKQDRLLRTEYGRRPRLGRPGKRGKPEAPWTMTAPIILAIWFGLVTGLLELGLLYARSQLLGWSTLSPPDQPPLRLDDTDRQPRPIPRLGPYCWPAWPGLAVVWDTTDGPALELPRVPCFAAAASRALSVRVHCPCRGILQRGGPLGPRLFRKGPPSGVHESSPYCSSSQPCFPDGKEARSFWESNGRPRRHQHHVPER